VIVRFVVGNTSTRPTPLHTGQSNQPGWPSPK